MQSPAQALRTVKPVEESEEINCLETGEAPCLHSDAVWLVP